MQSGIASCNCTVFRGLACRYNVECPSPCELPPTTRDWNRESAPVRRVLVRLIFLFLVKIVLNIVLKKIFLLNYQDFEIKELVNMFLSLMLWLKLEHLTLWCCYNTPYLNVFRIGLAYLRMYLPSCTVE